MFSILAHQRGQGQDRTRDYLFPARDKASDVTHCYSIGSRAPIHTPAAAWGDPVESGGPMYGSPNMASNNSILFAFLSS